eukprot:624431-Prorocentrum_minimum.AAC.1
MGEGQSGVLLRVLLCVLLGVLPWIPKWAAVVTPRKQMHPETANAVDPSNTCVRLVRRENIPTLTASDWSLVRIYPHVLRPIGPS